MNFYSEFGEDEWISRTQILPAEGFFVDVGCAFPGPGSNTLFLAERGWSGVVIDANPNYASAWNRFPKVTFIQGIIAPEPFVPFAFKEIAGHSRIESNNTKYAATTLDRILGGFKHRTIDFLSLDLEGAEFDALTTLNLAAWEPRFIVSEFSTAGLPEDFRVREFLIQQYRYNFIHQTHSNFIFRAP